MNKEKIIEQITKLAITAINKAKIDSIDDIEKLLDIIFSKFEYVVDIDLRPKSKEELEVLIAEKKASLEKLAEAD